MSGIFICYRRKDTDYIAGRLDNHLADHFGRDQVFIDINTMKLGADFADTIDTFVGSCDALVAVIGNDWLSDDGEGRRRIDQPADWVRQEIASALERDVLVVPVLVETARMPSEVELPLSLRKLARRNALDLSAARWTYEVERLIEVLEERVEPRRAVRSPAGAPPEGDQHEAWARPFEPPPRYVRPSTPSTRPAPPVPSPSPSPPSRWEPAAAQQRVPGVVPGLAKLAVPLVVAAIAIAIVAVSLSGRGGGGDRGATVIGPWTGGSPPLELVVESVEVGSTIRLHMVVRNTSQAAASLPLFGYFSAFDDTGHSYGVGSGEWATTFPPGEIRGIIQLDEPPQPGASTLKVGFSAVFGSSFEFPDNVYVEGVELA